MFNKSEDGNEISTGGRSLSREVQVMAAVAGVVAVLICGVIIWLISASGGSRNEASKEEVYSEETIEVLKEDVAAADTGDNEARVLIKDEGTLIPGIRRDKEVTQGEKGETGDQGEKGDKGEKGDRGQTGPRGKDGLDGQDGIQGERGLTGARGARGEAGQNGLDGRDGADGKSTYIAYAIDRNGTELTYSPTKSSSYIGICTTDSTTQPRDGSEYTWQPYRADSRIRVESTSAGNGEATFTITLTE